MKMHECKEMEPRVKDRHLYASALVAVVAAGVTKVWLRKLVVATIFVAALSSGKGWSARPIQ